MKIHRLDTIAADDRQVLVVSTPAAADRLAELLPKLTIISWIGNHNDVDWSTIQSRRVVLWADNTESALNAMAGVCGYVRIDANPSMKIMRKPKDKPEGWGPLMAIDEGWTGVELIEYAKANVVDLSFPKRLFDEVSVEYRAKRAKRERIEAEPPYAAPAEITDEDIEDELAAREG
jgi:hypothetical protein